MGDWLASLFGGSPGPTDREASSSEPQVTSQYPVAHVSPQPHKSPATAALSASADISDSYYHEPSAEMNQDARQLQEWRYELASPDSSYSYGAYDEPSPLAYQRTTAMSQPPPPPPPPPSSASQQRQPHRQMSPRQPAHAAPPRQALSTTSSANARVGTGSAARQPLKAYNAAGAMTGRRAASPSAIAASSARGGRDGGGGALATPSTVSGPPERRGFGMSTPRFDNRFDAGAKAMHAQQRFEAQQQMMRSFQQQHGGQLVDASRARGLHAAYAQCAALRRMLTALRVNRLLVRWRVAVVVIAANEELSHAARSREAMEEAVVEVHKRGEVSAQRAALVASQRVYLSAMLPQLMGTPRLTIAFASWVHACQLIEAEWALREEQHRGDEAILQGETLQSQLAAKRDELSHTKKMVQKPTMLERELTEQREELTTALAELNECQRRLLEQRRRADKAEDRVKSLQREVQTNRKRFATSTGSMGSPRPGAVGGGGMRGGGGGADEGVSGPTDRVDHLRQQLASTMAEKHRIESQLDGQRAKVQSLLAGARKSSAQRLTSLLLLRAHQALGPALRRWQAASLERAPELLAASGNSGVVLNQLDGEEGGGGGAAGKTTSDARQSRIISLQRELLDREAQLGQAHQQALQWREERSTLQQDLAEARADAQTARGMVTDAVLEATDALEREKGAIIEKQSEELKALRKRLAAAEKGWRETEAALAESESLLKASHVESETHKKERNEARREVKSAQIATEELEDAYRSEREAAAQRIADLEAKLEAQAAQAVVARRDRPITVQRDLDKAHKEVERLQAQLAEGAKRMTLMQKRVLDAEGRMEGLQKEVERYRSSNQNKLARALMPSPRGAVGGGGSGGGGGGGGGGYLSPRGERLIGGGGFGPQSPRGGGFGAPSAVQSARMRNAPSAAALQQPARQPRSAPPRHPGPSAAAPSAAVAEGPTPPAEPTLAPATAAAHTAPATSGDQTE